MAGDYAKWFLGRLRAVEAATANAETLVAGRFTAADIVIGYALRLAENIGLSKDFGPNVAAYWQRLQARDGYQQGGRRRNAGRRAAEGRAAVLNALPCGTARSAESRAFPELYRGDIRRDFCILPPAPSEGPQPRGKKQTSLPGGDE